MTKWLGRRQLVACAALLVVVVSVVGCAVRPPKPAGALSAVDAVQMGKDIYDAFDQPTYSGVPPCVVLNTDPAVVEVVGVLAASTRSIGDRTKRSPFSIPGLIDDALEDAQHAECHWSPLATPDHSSVNVEMTTYQKTPATRYARSAFAKIIADDKDEGLAYDRVALGSAACVAASAQTYYGLLRANNALIAVTIYTPRPIPSDWRSTIPTSPVYAVLSALNNGLGGGTGSPARSPDKHDNCS